MSIASLNQFAAKLRELPRVLAIEVAAKAAPIITELGKETFNASEDAYGNAWAPGAEGQKVDLKETGSLYKNIRYVAVGTKVRSALGVPYAKYQVGKRPVYPRGELPVAYASKLEALVAESASALLRTS